MKICIRVHLDIICQLKLTRRLCDSYKIIQLCELNYQQKWLSGDGVLLLMHLIIKSNDDTRMFHVGNLSRDKDVHVLIHKNASLHVFSFSVNLTDYYQSMKASKNGNQCRAICIL